MLTLASYLFEQGAALRAAVQECLDDPASKSVHRLRTSTRRIEAMLELASQLPDSPKMENESKRFRKVAKPIRRSAGRTRDLDVHREQLEKVRNRTVREDHEKLAELLKKEREREGQELQQLLKKRREKLLKRLDALEAAMLPARDLSYSAAQTNEVARQWFERRAGDLDPRDSLQFHDLRKAAKLARYMAETAGKKSATAKHFNRIQQASGEWHDWLTLTEEARRHLDPESVLVPVLVSRRDRTHREALALVQKHSRAAGAEKAATKKTGSMSAKASARQAA